MNWFARSRFVSGLAFALAFTLACPSVLAQTADPPKDAPADEPKAEKKKAEKKDAKDKDKKKKKKKKGEAEPAPAAAPLGDTLTGEAKDAYESGRLLYNDGDFENARLKFQHAYELSKDPRLLWNMAATEKQQRRYDKVLALAEKYLAEGADELSEQDRADARALIDTVRTLVAEVTITVNEPDAEVDVDGEKVGQSPLPSALIVSQGDRAFSVKKTGFLPFKLAQNVVGGSKLAIDVKLVPEVHEGTLRVVAGLGDEIQVDGKQVGKGQWQGKLESGSHTVTVTGRDKLPYQAEVVVSDNQLRTERVVLRTEPPAPKPVPAQTQENQTPWMWIGGGAALAIGLGIAGYLLFKPSNNDQTAQQHLSGTLPPGYVQLSF